MTGPVPSPRRFRSWLLLGLLTAGNPARRRRILEIHGSLNAAAAAADRGERWSALLRPSGGSDIFRAGPATGASEVASFVEDPDARVEKEIALAGKLGAKVLCLEDPAYPASLRKIPDPPPVIYISGQPEALCGPLVAVVGARRASRYGASVSRRIARDLAARGIGVVSGGARGIDSEAHRGALESGGPTVTVLGSGLDVPYPEENGDLFGRIARSGAVISEFPFGTSPLPYHFPIRNRLIAGLSLGVVVVEAREGSGSLITADLALDGGLEVFAVPGEVTSALSEGPNRLIREGGALVRSAEDVLEGLPCWALGAVTARRAGPPVEEPAGEPGHQRILEALAAHQGRTVDDLASALAMPAGDLLSALMELELTGKVDQLPGGLFVRRI